LPYPPEDVTTELVSDVTAEAVDLGAGEGDEELLRDLAGLFVELGLAPRRTAGREAAR
jgi:hypothetical protein